MSAPNAGQQAAPHADIELYVRLNTELVAMLDHFTSLVKATREGLDEDAGSLRPEGGPGAGRERRAPGELLEVLAEKLLAAGHQCVHTVSSLKGGAMVSDFDALIAKSQALGSALQTDSTALARGLDGIRREAQALLGELEQQYYGSLHRSPPGQPGEQQGAGGSGGLAELCSQIPDS